MLEDAAITLAGIRVIVCDRVRQPTGLAYHRHSSISECVQLRESARLVTRRHQQQVCAGDDTMRQCLVISLDEHDSPREFIGQLPQGRRIGCFAGAQDDHRGVTFAEDLC